MRWNVEIVLVVIAPGKSLQKNAVQHLTVGKSLPRSPLRSGEHPEYAAAEFLSDLTGVSASWCPSRLAGVLAQTETLSLVYGTYLPEAVQLPNAEWASSTERFDLGEDDLNALNMAAHAR